MLCDLVRSSDLAGRLDPEELQDILRAYQDTADAVVRRFGGVIARYVGDGLLIYFGYPQAHEDDAERAVRAGLGIVGAMRELQSRLRLTLTPLPHIPLQVRIGLHTGVAVMGTIGDSSHRGDLEAVGETPNLAARVQGCAEPDTVLLTEATYRLLRGAFVCAPLGPRALKGIAAPVSLYRVLGEAGATKAHEVHGSILEKYNALGGAASSIDETRAIDTDARPARIVRRRQQADEKHREHGCGDRKKGGEDRKSLSRRSLGEDGSQHGHKQSLLTS
jgi:class 3 adenylate cyclase